VLLDHINPFSRSCRAGKHEKHPTVGLGGSASFGNGMGRNRYVCPHMLVVG
jgi:hypothetical protein